MKIEILKSNKMIVESLKNNLYISDDSVLEAKLSQMSAHEIFERFLNWNNIIGYGRRLWNVHETLLKSVLNDKINFEELSAEDESGDVLETLRKRGGFSESVYEDDEESKSFMKYVNALDIDEAFGEYLNWNGIIGFENMVLNAIKTIKKASA